MTRKIEVIGAPGFVDRFPGQVVLEGFKAVDDRGDLNVILTEAGEYLVVPSKFVHDPSEGEFE